MFDFIDKILSPFESCFSRKAAFRWFVILTVGLMLRSDKLGVTSVIRDLALKPDCYLSMLHFFPRFFLVCGLHTAMLVSDSPPVRSSVSGRQFQCPHRGWCKTVQRRAAYPRGEKTLPGI